ncbi:CPBP family intramembrane glutamic endopeptidase [Herbiconiux sp.]|uniref:CPBP family intramembrane glutamic endopeptidase n=1 Tax=Herbiconiux sp. TaxID=1871186 RepID=UPI0025B9E5C2|nr:CPBP family intramembrane glutamic endopeptidase [Herbiconiux sp.]
MPEALEWTRIRRRRLWSEIAIVLGVSLGASAVYSIVNIISRLTAETALADQTATINGSLSSREWLDLTYQLLALLFDLVPVALVFYLLAISGGNPFRRMGFDLRRPASDVGRGWLLVLVIGVPGIALYFVGRALGITVDVQPAPLDTYWWTTPILILSALRAALQEELIVVAYLFTRLRQLGWHKWQIILSAAVLRGSYHLYQGIGPFVGNVVMGVVFGWCYWRWGRVMPLVIAHWIIDIASFVGYAWALASFPQLFG